MLLPRRGRHVIATKVRGRTATKGTKVTKENADTRLNRDVALKMLPEGFALDPDRVMRFAREAQVLASLNHPHIAAIYRFEESGGIAGALEPVEGPTLADRILKGPIPLDEAILARDRL